MKFSEIEVDLQEVRMGASDLSSFASSSMAKGIRAGFEAELCFTGLGDGDPDEESEPDYDADESSRSIDRIINFFSGDYNDRHTLERLQDQLYEDFHEWVYESMQDEWGNVEEDVVRQYVLDHEYDKEDEIKKYLEDELDLGPEEILSALDAGKRPTQRSDDQKNLFPEDNEAYAHYSEALEHAKKVLEERIEELISDQDRTYDMIREEWEEEQRGEYTESEWLSAENLDAMSDIEIRYDIMWPYWSHPESQSGNEYNESNARDLARSLRQTLEVQVTASSGYHSTKRSPNLWIIEPDGSLHAEDGDMPAEIISPPMPLDECIIKLREFVAWADSMDAYTNESTGLHVGVSLPSDSGFEQIDYAKLALFLGDRYVLEQFNRESNSYCISALQKIESDIKNNKSENAIKIALDDMRKGLLNIASSVITNSQGHGKYTSINMKGDYVEFRSMGGSQYLDNIDLVIGMIQRFAMAMTIAADPNAYKQEYAKKLYKLISSKLSNPSVIDIFSKYVAGELPKVELKSFIRQSQLQRQFTKEPGKRMWWNVQPDTGSGFVGASIEVVATNAEEAKLEAIKHWGLNPQDINLNKFSAKPVRSYIES